ncbi:MAG: 23S rRNA (guanosine(2251)-2'-O)-methyltransferase RlmB [Crocinitomicaceae bacterium]
MERKQSYMRKERTDLIFGVHAVIEALKAERSINKILIQKGIQKETFNELRDALKGQQFQLQFVPNQKLDSLTSGNHQGVIAFVTPIEYQEIEILVDQMLEQGKKPTILVLDRITDVRNFGAIARTAECEGVDAILIPSKGSALVTSDAMKASAGALNRIPVCKTDDLKNSLFYLQQSGLRLIACTEKSATPLYQVNLRGSVAVIMGSEENGITQDLINMSDIKAKIPMRGEISSLNVGVATGMVLYEKLRQELYS